MIAAALVATVGDAKHFANGRQMAASLGLTPKQHSSGGKNRLLGISKRGDSYLRSLLIHGARSAIRTAAQKEDRLSQWLTALAARRQVSPPARGLPHTELKKLFLKAAFPALPSHEGPAGDTCPYLKLGSSASPRNDLAGIAKLKCEGHMWQLSAS
jgi:Transposase IS116/IS110/IS902 family